jgi:hypothetical protein
MATRWSVPRMWEGATVAILASGPSMSQRVADSVRNVPTIAVNNCYELAPWAEMLYAADSSWWDHHAQRALKFAGLKVTCHESVTYRAVNWLRQSGVEGFDPDPKMIRTGGNSGYQAIHVAIQAGAKRVLLFGYDMHGTHWFGKHPSPLRNTDPQSYEVWVSRFSGLIGHGAEIINCTPGSAITCFPKMTLEEALQ